MLPKHSLDLANEAQTIVLGQDFLLVIPHPTPRATATDTNSVADAFCNAVWKQWPPPHPLAFAGGPAGCPALQRAWMDPEDPRKPSAIVFQPLESTTHGSISDALALNEGALRRPLQALSLTCCDWRRSSPQFDDEFPKIEQNAAPC